MRKYQPGCDALFWAAFKNDYVDSFYYLLKQGVSIGLRYQGMTSFAGNGVDPIAVSSARGVSPIYLVLWNWKALRTDRAMIKALHQKHGNVAGSGSDWRRHVHPKHLGVLFCQLEAMNLLLERGAYQGAVLKEETVTALHHVQISKWGFETSHQLPEDDSIRVQHQSGERKITDLSGYNPRSIVLARVDVLLPQDALKLVWLLLGADPENMSAYSTRPEIKQQ